MNHIEYAKELNSFSYNCYNEELEFITNETKDRILLGRLYYALVHFYFSKYPVLAASYAPSKHETLLQIIMKERSESEARVFKTLKKLREWADYHPLNQEPFSLNMKRLFHQVNKIINAKNSLQ